MLTQLRLKELLHYNSETGIFTWVRPTSNRVAPGEIVSRTNEKGYVIVGIDGERYRAHRLAYLYMTGEMPEDQIDHENGNKADNRWTNLRPASNSQNHMNKGLQSNNTSGVKGVTLHKRSGKWLARVMVQGKYHNLGYYDDLTKAAAGSNSRKSRTTW